MKINLELDYRTILANQARPVHFALQFQADSIANPRPKPAAFCVVLDRSGSMEGKPLVHAKEAARVAIRNLRREDYFGLVVFESTAQVVIPLQQCQARQPFIDLVNKLTTAGSTNLTAGWMLGRDELKKAPADASRRLLLLSDGLFNVGIVEPVQVRQIVASGLEADSIRTSSLGFGDSYDEKLLADLASATNGQFYDADSAEKLPGIFAQELDGLQRLAVQNLRVRFKKLDFCESFELLSDYPRIELPDGRKEFAVGDLVSDEERILCFALEVLPLPSVQGKPVVSLEGEKLAELELLYDEITDSGITSKTQQQIVRIQATPNPDDVRVNETVLGWVAMQQAGLTIKRVTDEISGGNQDKALAILEQAIRYVAQHGSSEKVGPAMQMLRELLDHIELGTLSARHMKMHKSREYYSRKSSSRLPPGYHLPSAPQPPLPPKDPGSPSSGPVA